MQKLAAILVLPLSVGLLAGSAFAADKEGKRQASDGKKGKVAASPRSDAKPEDAILPKHKRGDVNLQAQGRPPVVRKKVSLELQGDSVYTQGVLEAVDDGALLVRYRGKATDLPKNKAVKRYRIARLQDYSRSALMKRVETVVRLEIKRDARGQPYVVRFLKPR